MELRKEIIENYPFLSDLGEEVLEEFFKRVIVNNYESDKVCLIINKVV